MSVTIKHALELDVMKNAKIIAGGSGIGRVIKRVSFIDSPIEAGILDLDGKFLIPGDFFISSFFAVKDNLEKMLEIVKVFSYTCSSALCIINQYLTELPQEILDYANEHSYPIILVDKDVPYGDIIRDIMLLIIRDQEDTILELKINNLLELDSNSDEAEKVILDINKHFKRYVMALNCKCSNFHLEKNKLDFLKNTINNIKEWMCLNYKDTILIIMTFDRYPKDNITAKTKYAIEQIKSIHSGFVIGISNLHSHLGQANRSITEAIIACESHETIGHDIIYYKELGTYKLLMPLKTKSELREFHDEIILPIMNYDMNYKKNLLETAICFIDNDGNYSKTANEMFLHENSIRFRINKIKEILNMHDRNLIFYEQLSIAIKIYKIFKLNS
ncbi:PucR family transcriptional regulator [Candidatus Formimonas warabiya]|uniref:PucR family transcriptional regulator n=1 Tax=Formimonas warabiya TaxID=1761012 RepID=A0A3G1KQA2_FORW1|nr:PucR family transcriptional regulator [Candidatus Formimonas warabiya]ATW24649.1 hypothetical protein DCMF_07530 [Candidatus Formimonas warabiya]